MDIGISNENGGKLVRLNGDLDGHTSDQVTKALQELIVPEVRLIIDMEGCPYVSSAGLRTLLTIGKNAKMNNGEMQIINLKEEVRDVMVMTGFSSIFKGFE